jgi:hypothetical protein
MNGWPDIKVVIRTSDGRYIVAEGKKRRLTREPSEATVFDYFADAVWEQLKRLQDAFGIRVVATPVNPREVFETFDHCGRQFRPLQIFFDGQKFLCSECLSGLLGARR